MKLINDEAFRLLMEEYLRGVYDGVSFSIDDPLQRKEYYTIINNKVAELSEDYRLMKYELGDDNHLYLTIHRLSRYELQTSNVTGETVLRLNIDPVTPRELIKICQDLRNTHCYIPVTAAWPHKKTIMNLRTFVNKFISEYVQIRHSNITDSANFDAISIADTKAQRQIAKAVVRGNLMLLYPFSKYYQIEFVPRTSSTDTFDTIEVRFKCIRSIAVRPEMLKPDRYHGDAAMPLSSYTIFSDLVLEYSADNDALYCDESLVAPFLYNAIEFTIP